MTTPFAEIASVGRLWRRILGGGLAASLESGLRPLAARAEAAA